MGKMVYFLGKKYKITEKNKYFHIKRKQTKKEKNRKRKICFEKCAVRWRQFFKFLRCSTRGMLITKENILMVLKEMP